MRAIVEASDLAKAMHQVERAAARYLEPEKRVAMPAADAPSYMNKYRILAKAQQPRILMGHVMLEARPGVLRMVAATPNGPEPCWAANLEYAPGEFNEIVAREIPARGVVAGTVAIPARMLRDLGRVLSGPILLEHQAQYAFRWGAEVEAVLVMARLGNFTAHIPATPADLMPEALRGIDLGDWGLMAPVARLGVAA